MDNYAGVCSCGEGLVRAKEVTEGTGALNKKAIAYHCKYGHVTVIVEDIPSPEASIPETESP